jgi:hypothetical protein
MPAETPVEETIEPTPTWTPMASAGSV